MVWSWARLVPAKWVWVKKFGWCGWWRPTGETWPWVRCQSQGENLSFCKADEQTNWLNFFESWMPENFSRARPFFLKKTIATNFSEHEIIQCRHAYYGYVMASFTSHCTIRCEATSSRMRTNTSKTTFSTIVCNCRWTCTKSSSFETTCKANHCPGPANELTDPMIVA